MEPGTNNGKIHIYWWRKMAVRAFMHSVVMLCFFVCVAVSHVNRATGNVPDISRLQINEELVVKPVHEQLKGRPANYQVHGIDVARYQRQVNWDLIGRSGVEFVFIKATEGIGLKDSFFDLNWERARMAGIKRGAYHFFLAEKDAKLQAANFLITTKYQPGDLPPVLDVETTRDVQPAQMRSGMRTWLKLVENAYGVKPIIYTGYTFYKRHLDGYFEEYPLWIAHYNGSEKDPDCGKWLFWQHSDRGTVAGINKEVDLNVFRNGREKLDSLCIPAKQTKEELLAQLLAKSIQR